jgi:hypothetical protein
MRMTQGKDPLERAVDILVFLPLGTGVWFRDAAPDLFDTAVGRGRAEYERRTEELQRQITHVRSLGEVALAFGWPKLKARLEDRVAGLIARAPQAAPAPAPPPKAPDVAPTPVAVLPPPDAPGSEKLPIPGYDALSASQVVERLAGLDPAELDAVHAYEATHRQRRTILGKIEQLAV